MSEQEILPIGDIANNYDSNPMIVRHGRGPDGSHCKTCRSLRSQNFGSQRSYWKCIQYSVSHCTASDFRLKWDACRLYEEDK